MRLGTYDCALLADSRVHTIYGGSPLIQERHRHRFEFNNIYREEFQKNGFIISGTSPD